MIYNLSLYIDRNPLSFGAFVIFLGIPVFLCEISITLATQKHRNMKSIYQTVSTEQLETLLDLGSVTFLYHKKGGNLQRILATTSPYRIPNSQFKLVRRYKTKIMFYNLETGEWDTLMKTTFYWLDSVYPEDNLKLLASL